MEKFSQIIMMKNQEIQFAFWNFKSEYFLNLQDLVPSTIAPFMFLLTLTDSNLSPRSI